MIHDDWIEGNVTCHATEGADCRLICSEGCDGWNITDHEHELVDQGKCNFVEWMDAEGLLESHVGTHAPTDGFIEIEYEDDHYTWTYSHAR
jgi:hypothetical protein